MHSNIYIEGEGDLDTAHSVLRFINNYNGVHTEGVAEVVVPEASDYSFSSVLHAIFCCCCIFYDMYQEGGDSTSMSGMHNHQDL